MIKRWKKKRRDRWLKGLPVFEQILALIHARIKNPEVLKAIEPEAAVSALYETVAADFRQQIQAGLELSRETWDYWGRFEGGRHLRAWWIDAKTSVSDLHDAKLARLIVETQMGTGKAERMIVAYMDEPTQMRLLLRIMGMENENPTAA